MRLATAVSHIFRRVARVALPMCGVRTALGSAEVAGMDFGSPSKTSSPAPAMRLACSASTSAASSTTPPRAVFTRMAVGFIFAISAAPIRWCTAGEYGTMTTTKSDSASSRSRSTQVALSRLSSASGMRPRLW